MNKYLQSKDWIYQKCDGKFYAVSPTENTRLISLEQKYGKYPEVPSDQEFDAFELVKNEDGDYYCNWKYPIKLKVNKIEFFLSVTG